ncbi:MAG: YitT family protein [Clostridia bacterium]|nr:YitT family protein [Clostridia bacterium]
MRKFLSPARLAQLALGAAILAFGLFNIHSRCRITEGGVLGMTLLIRRWTGLSPAVSEVALDAICYLLGLKYLGRAFLPRAAAATGCYALFYALFERTGYLFPDLSGHPLAAAAAGALFVGLGVGLVVRAGGAAGGDDALALVISKRARWPIARAYLLTDTTVLLLSLSYIPLRNIACSLITVTLSSFIIGRVQAFGPRGKKT